MNCFNGEKYLKEALESVIQQTYINWELIFWDNQSTDRSAMIFKSFEDSRMRYFYSDEFTDLGGARAKACNFVKGEYLSILDCDDKWFPNKLEAQLECLINSKCGICISNPIYFNSKKRKNLYKKKPPEGKVTKKLIENYFVVLPTVLLDMKYVRKLDKFFNKHYSHIADFDLIIRLSTICEFVYCPKTLAGWRIHNTNASFLEKEKFIYEKLKWIKEARLNYKFRNYLDSINNLEILTKAEGCNLVRKDFDLKIDDLINFSGNLRSRLKVYFGFFPFLYKIFTRIKNLIFFINWNL